MIYPYGLRSLLPDGTLVQNLDNSMMSCCVVVSPQQLTTVRQNFTSEPENPMRSHHRNLNLVPGYEVMNNGLSLVGCLPCLFQS